MSRLLLSVVASTAAAAAHGQDLRASPPLPPLPIELETSDYTIRVVEVAGGLENPWSIAWLPNGDALVTERAGRLRLLHDGRLEPEPIAGVPEVHITFLAGLLDVLAHPDFESNRFVYLSYARATSDPANGAAGGPATATDAAAQTATTAVARARLDGRRLRDLEEIFVASTRSTSPTNFGGRMAFGRDGHLYLTVGERQEQNRAQDPLDHAGKVLRLRDDGTVPDDNPFVANPRYLPEIYTLGHRSPQGLAVHPETGAIWENEHGPLGGDELNILVPGRNYGWPLVSYGKDYDGTQITDTGLSSLPELEPPFMYWVPSIAISGLSFYTGDAFPEWRGNAFVGSMMAGRIRWTGHVQRLTFNEDGRSITREPVIAELHQRVRDVRPGPDGFIYVLTDQNPGSILRLEPVAAH